MSITAEQSLSKNWKSTLNSGGGFCHYFPTKNVAVADFGAHPTTEKVLWGAGDGCRGTGSESFSRLLPAWSREQ